MLQEDFVRFLGDFENPDQFEIANETGHFAMIGLSRQQISSLLPSGSSKKKA
jgi:hypothetical protein